MKPDFSAAIAFLQQTKLNVKPPKAYKRNLLAEAAAEKEARDKGEEA